MKSDINKIIALSGILFLAISWSCTDDPDVPPVSNINYSEGVFVINEGNFGTGSGTISFLNRDGTGLEHKIYQQANILEPLGNVVQSMNIIDDRAFIVVNNSSRIVIVNKFNFKRITAIEDIDQPRYLVNANNWQFAVTCWDNTVKIFDLNTLNKIDEIETGLGPEKMLMVGDQIWILNQGGLSVDSTVTIADFSSKSVQTLNVYPRPTGIQMDKNGNVWLMCSGRKAYHPGGFSPTHLLCIDPDTFDFIVDITIQEDEHDAIDLEISNEGTVLYYLFKGDIYSLEIDAVQPDDQPLVDYQGTFYSMGYDPQEHTLYGADALDYMQNGEVYKYDAASGTLLMNFKSGIIPGEFYFSN